MGVALAYSGDILDDFDRDLIDAALRDRGLPAMPRVEDFEGEFEEPLGGYDDSSFFEILEQQGVSPEGWIGALGEMFVPVNFVGRIQVGTDEVYPHAGALFIVSAYELARDVRLVAKSLGLPGLDSVPAGYRLNSWIANMVETESLPDEPWKVDIDAAWWAALYLDVAQFVIVNQVPVSYC